MYRVVHFEIQADDPQRAMTFYGDVFGWEFTDYSGVAGSPYWGVVTGADEAPGINGGLMPRRGSGPASGQPTNAYVCTIGANDWGSMESRILGAGGQAVVPKYALPGMAWQGYFTDTEGNIFGLHVPDPNAA